MPRSPSPGLPNLVREVEECALNAWPALQQMLLDGWWLRFAEGYTRRANSVNPIHPGERPPDGKVAECERLYAERELPSVFKITPLVQPPGLEPLLEARGYRCEASTSVQILRDFPGGPEATGSATAPEPAQARAAFHPVACGDWLEHFHRLDASPHRPPAVHQRILEQVLTPAIFGVLEAEGEVTACGVAVLQAPWVGIFDVVTDPARRRQGLGAQLMQGLLAWARAGGARHAYLQVMLDNAPALRLYERLGFAELYRYHYRVK